jgi:NAD(P)-dependent dehydrogenase (short-subunit alcohol dehydrogenase family)
LGAYQATKFAVVGLAETIRIEHPEIAVTVIYPSGMLTRHLESSALARPADLGPGEVDGEDLMAMMASRPMTERDFTDADTAAANAIVGILAGEPHVITHGDLAPYVARYQAAIDEALRRVAERHGD